MKILYIPPRKKRKIEKVLEEVELLLKRIKRELKEIEKQKSN